MSNYLVSDTDLTSVANAIRTKGGTSAQLEFPTDFVSAIGAIPSGGGSADAYDLSLPSGEITTEMTRLNRIGARTGITKVNAPYATSLYAYAFYGFTALTELYAPLANGDGYSASIFDGCTAIEAIVLPSWNERVHNYVFQNCSNLEAVDLKGASFSGSDIFKNCSKLNILVLRRNTVCSLSGVNRFAGTPFASDGTGGTLYVTNDLISSYESATNWSTLLGYTNNQIKSIESTHTDPTAPIDLTLYYADGTLIPT